eukprot:5518718-Amphidinium_carterae.5
MLALIVNTGREAKVLPRSQAKTALVAAQRVHARGPSRQFEQPRRIHSCAAKKRKIAELSRHIVMPSRSCLGHMTPKDE